MGKIGSWFQNIGLSIYSWWRNEKVVLIKWLFPLIDAIVVPKITDLIRTKKQEIINSLNTISALDNARKCATWLKDILTSLLGSK